MAKKDSLEPQARELFVIHQMSLADISRKLNVSVRTLQDWKKNGDWETQKSSLGGNEKSFHAALFKLGEVIARKITDEELNGSEAAPERYGALNRIIDAAEKSRKYEAIAPVKKEDKRSPEEKGKEALSAISGILGLK
jgi:uncharacterized protein YjcR